MGCHIQNLPQFLLNRQDQHSHSHLNRLLDTVVILDHHQF